jgi:putative DNA primase/helicase
VAFDSGNLKPVAEAIKAKYGDKEIIIAADNDQYYENRNPGLEKAWEAAKSIGSYVVKPEFKDVSMKPKDFNDLHILEGADAVRAAVLQRDEKSEKSDESNAGFHLTEDGLFYVFRKNGETLRVSDYISQLAFVKESDGTTSRLVEFKDHKGRLEKAVLQPKIFANHGEQLKIYLASKGFVYSGNPRVRSKLTEYLLESVPDKEVRLIRKIGFTDGAYMRPDKIIGKLSDEIMFDASANDAAFSSGGTAESWIINVSMYCRNNSRLMFSVSAAFASMLLKACGISSGGFHLSGASSAGKTTCLRVAASVFGSPSYVKTWKTTDNAVENTAFKRNDALLVLDELSEMSRKAGDVAYMLSDGEGKDRLDKNCNARELYKWRLLFLSSGEVDLTSHLAESNKQLKAGQEMRFINIPAKSAEGGYGIFESLHGFADIPDFAKHLQRNAEKHYGAVSIKFIEKVLEASDIRESYDYDYGRVKATRLPLNASEQDKRVFERFMFVGFAGELATKYGLTGWNSGESYEAAVKCFNDWLRIKGGVGNFEDKRLMDQTRAFFDLHGCSRFFDLDSFQEQKINNMAGYKRVLPEKTVFYVFTSTFKNEICKGFARDQAIEILKKNGILTFGDKNECYQQKATPHGNKRVYVFESDKL